MKAPESESSDSTATVTESDKKNKPTNSMGGQIHNILMDEFKKAHQKMFKNGYVENEYHQLLSNGKNDETREIGALDNNEHKLEVSRWEQLVVDLR